MLRWRLELIRTKAGARQIMVGRPRKQGTREANGRLQRVYENPRAQVAKQPHRALVPKQHRETPEAESEFGRLVWLKQITPAEYEAGKRYAALASEYRSAKGYPPLTPQAIDLASVRGGMGGEMPFHVVRAIAQRYDSAFESICGQRAQKAVADYAVREQPLLGDGLKYLRCGLRDLVNHFDIDVNLRTANLDTRSGKSSRSSHVG